MEFINASTKPVHTGKPEIEKDQAVTLIHTVFKEDGAINIHAGFTGTAVTDPKYKRGKGWFVDVLFFGRKIAVTVPCCYLSNKKLGDI